MVEEQPMVVVQFACQQIKCTRDKFGNVVDGDPNSIQVRAAVAAAAAVCTAFF
jgi:predicted lipid-binding transport protein (Tim44 family)